GFSEEETAEFDSAITIESIEQTLQALGHETNRIGNIWSLTHRLVRGDRWDLVFNIAEGLYGLGREAQVPALLDAYQIPYTFSDPLVLSLTLHKGMTKRILRDLGIPTPDFVEIHSLQDVDKVTLPFPLFAKPIAEGTGKGISTTSKIANADELKARCAHLLTAYQQSVLVEAYLPGREFTVGIVGEGEQARSVGIIEVVFLNGSDKNAYGYSNKKDWVDNIQYRRVEDQTAALAVEYSLAAWRGVGCRDGGRIDVRTDVHGIPNIMEINPLAGLRPDYSDLPLLCNFWGIRYIELIDMIIKSAQARIPAPPVTHYVPQQQGI
ncbi:MAG: D-alanine--D-alanine ligase, partial [Calditrichaeota bacterium]